MAARKMVIKRSEAEEMLLDNECGTIRQMAYEGDMSYIHAIFYSGFKGYVHFTNEELATEIKEQGLHDASEYEDVVVVDDPKD